MVRGRQRESGMGERVRCGWAEGNRTVGGAVAALSTSYPSRACLASLTRAFGFFFTSARARARSARADLEIRRGREISAVPWLPTPDLACGLDGTCLLEVPVIRVCLGADRVILRKARRSACTLGCSGHYCYTTSPVLSTSSSDVSPNRDDLSLSSV